MAITLQEATVAASLKSNGDIIIGMDPDKYKAAVEGNIHTFNQNAEQIQLMLTPNKNTLLHIHFTALTENVSKDFVRHILDLCPALLLQVNAKGESILHIAARYGHSDIVKILIERAKTLCDIENGMGANNKVIRLKNHEGDTALHEAVRYNHIDVVRILITEEPKLTDSANEACETPLFLAIERRYQDMALEILPKCRSLAYAGPYGRTTLHAAVITDDEEIVGRLLKTEHSSALVKQADKRGRIPLHLAAQYTRESWKPGVSLHLTELLLKNDRKTAYIRDDDGLTAIHMAAKFNNVDVMEMILSHCPDCTEIVDNNGCNVLHYAVKFDEFCSGTKLILEDSSLSNLYNEKDAAGNTALHHAALSLNYRKGLTDHPRVDKMAFNKENCTAFGTILKNERFRKLPWIQKHEIYNMKQFGAISGAREETIIRSWFDIPNEIKYHDVEDKDGDENPNVKRAKEPHLVVATLIATVTFAAAFTLPGGTIQEGKYLGTPILKHNPAFQAFVIADTIAMVLSATAVLMHLFLAITTKESAFDFLSNAFYLTILAMGAMIIAFVTGTFAVLGVSSGLGIATLLIGLSFFFPLVKSCYSVLY